MGEQFENRRRLPATVPLTPRQKFVALTFRARRQKESGRVYVCVCIREGTIRSSLCPPSPPPFRREEESSDLESKN